MIRDLIGSLFCWIGWHRPSGFVEVGEMNLVSTCGRCGRMIMRDSQGGWF